MKPVSPVLNASDHLATGLRYLWPFTEGAGEPVDLVNSHPMTGITTAGTSGRQFSWVDTEYGMGIKIPNNWGLPVSVVPNPGSTLAILWDRRSSNNNTNARILSGASTRQIRYNQPAGALVAGSVSSPPGIAPAGEWGFDVISMTGSHVRFFVDGEICGVAQEYGSTSAWTLFNYDNFQYNIATSSVSYLAIWDRSLDASEIADLCNDGWLRLLADRRYNPFRSHVFHSHRIGGVA